MVAIPATTGRISFAGGATVIFNSNFTFGASSDLSGAGSILFTGGTQTINGTYGLSTLNKSGGTTSFNIPLSLTTVNFTAGTLGGTERGT